MIYPFATGFLGLISGLATNHFLNHGDKWDAVLPGLIFGIIVTPIIILNSKSGAEDIPYFKTFSYIIISTLAYYFALRFTSIASLGNGYIAFFGGGFLGALILFIGLRIKIPFKIQIFLVAALIGGILGSVSYYLTPDHYSDLIGGANGWILYPIWQTGIGALIGYVLNKHQRTK
jgi:hypothetical protein